MDNPDNNHENNPETLLITGTDLQTVVDIFGSIGEYVGLLIDHLPDDPDKSDYPEIDHMLARVVAATTDIATPVAHMTKMTGDGLKLVYSMCISALDFINDIADSEGWSHSDFPEND